MTDAIELGLVGTLALVVGVVFTLRAASGARRPPAPLGRAARSVGPYALLDKIAAGAMGEIYRARHRVSGHLCALKLLPRDAGERERRQFELEARAGARVEHPNVVAVYEHGRAADGTQYLAMELLDGVDLEQLVEREGPLSPDRAVEILLQIAAALREVHELGLVHRDIKPQNILLCRGPAGEERAKLIDFGLVKELASGTELPGGSIVGTPLYIAPEALTAPDEVDGRADLYGLGAVAHFLISGAPVFSGQSVVEVCGHHLLTAPEPLSHVSGGVIGSDLESVVLDCLAKQPSARPSSALELIQRLERCVDRVEVNAPLLDMQRATRRACAGRLRGARCPAAACLAPAASAMRA